MRIARLPTAKICLRSASLCLVLASACGNGTPEPTCPSGGSGTLAVTITGLPNGTAAAVTVSTGTPQPLTASQTLTLSGQAYTLTAARVASPDALVRTAYEAQISNANPCVQSGQTTSVTVTYAPIASSGKLWTGNSGSASLLGFAPSLLGASGAPAATAAANANGAGGFTFDAQGNLWAIGATTADPPIARFPASALGTSGNKAPDLTLTSPSFVGIPGPVALAFDAAGALWVSLGAAGKVVKFNPAQLQASGNPTPAVELSGITGPSGLAFDTAGNLWISAENRVLQFTAARLGASTSGPDLQIDAQSPPPVIGSLPSPIGLAFDASNNLWVNFSGVLARLTPTDRSGTGSKTVTPAIQLGLDVAALPEGIAFDESGGLWVALAAGKFGRLASTQLTTSATVTPTVVITSPDVAYAGWFALYPAPAGLPLYHRLP